MDFFDVIERRHSCRKFAAADAEPAKIDRILAAARAAPSAGNLQAFTIVVVRDEATRSRLAAAAYGQDFVAEAPVVLAFLADERRSESKYGSRGVKLFCVQDATIAASYAQLAATALGLSSCWVGAFDDAQVASALQAGPRLHPVALMPVGVAAADAHPRVRRPLTELVKTDHV
jgi:nitroreductase